jgi:hypothetical protein
MPHLPMHIARILLQIKFTKVYRNWDLDGDQLVILHEGMHPMYDIPVYILQGCHEPRHVKFDQYGGYIIGTSEVGKLIGFDNLDLTGGV